MIAKVLIPSSLKTQAPDYRTWNVKHVMQQEQWHPFRKVTMPKNVEKEERRDKSEN